MQEDLRASLAQISAEWDKAEKLIKLAERVRAEVVFPSVNELRYAGRRLVDAWHLVDAAAENADQKREFEGLVKDALYRCHCACHDAIDATVLFVQAAMDQYETEFGLAALIKHFPEVADLRLSLAEADELIVNSREHRGQRAAEYDALARDHLPVITLVYKKIKTNRAALEALIEQNSRTEKTESRRYRGGLVWAALFTLFGVVVGGVITVATSDRGEAIAETISLSQPEPAAAVASIPSTGAKPKGPAK